MEKGDPRDIFYMTGERKGTVRDTKALNLSGAGYSCGEERSTERVKFASSQARTLNECSAGSDAFSGRMDCGLPVWPFQRIREELRHRFLVQETHQGAAGIALDERHTHACQSTVT